MGNVFDNNIPPDTLKDFKREFNYKGSTWSDTDRRGQYQNDFTSDKLKASKRIEQAKQLGSRSSIRSPFNTETVQYEVGGWFDSYARGLEKDFNSNYRSNFRRDGDESRDSKFLDEVTDNGSTYGKGTRTSYNKGGWFDSYKKSVEKTHIGSYHENYSRKGVSHSNDYTSDIDIFRKNTHRPDNIHYNARPISRNQISSDSSQAQDDKLGRVVQNFDREVDRTKPSDIYKKVDEAIGIAEKLEASTASNADQIENLENLIEVFELMDKMISQDIANFQGTRNADKANRGQDTGKQTSTEKGAIDNMMSRTNDKAELSAKRQDLQNKLVSKKTFNR